MKRQRRPFVSYSLICFVVLFLCTPGEVNGEESISIVNAGFEDPNLSDGQEWDVNVPGWDITNGVGGILNPTITDFPNEAPDGNNVLYLMNYGGTVFQTLSGVVEEGKVYRLEALVGQPALVVESMYEISIWAGNSRMVFQNGWASSAGNFNSISLDFAPTPGGAEIGTALGIMLKNPNIRPGDLRTCFDDIRLIVFDDCNGNGIPDHEESGEIDSDGDGLPDDCDTPNVHNVTQDTWHFKIQQAIDTANVGDEIEVLAGRYWGAVDFLGKAINLHSFSGDPNDTIIDGSGLYHVVQFVNGEDSNTILEGFTITGGDASGDGSGYPYNHTYYGGGMYIEDSSPVVTKCCFAENAAMSGAGLAIFLNNYGDEANIAYCSYNNNTATISGGGIYLYGDRANVTVEYCTFSHNSASSAGGLNNEYCYLTITHCVFTGNSATDSGGGGLYNSSGRAIVSDCRFINNDANTDGGGMSNFSTVVESMSRCVFSQNTAVEHGGALRNFNSHVIANECSFSGNSANIFGGGIYNGTWNDSGHTTMYLNNSSFTGNSAGDKGGGIFNNRRVTAYLTNCSLYKNNAVVNAGGISIIGLSDQELDNCILWENSPEEISADGFTTTTARYSNIKGGFSGYVIIDSDPLFVDPNGLDNILGTEDDNLDLQTGSPCIDSGDTLAISAGTYLDVAGNPRAVDDPNTPNTGVTILKLPVDMGAYEFQPNIPCRPEIVGDVNCDGVVDLRDFALMAANWLGRVE